MHIQNPTHENRLDSLRGYAAFIVVIHHCLLTFTFSGTNYALPSLFEPAWQPTSWQQVLNRLLLAFIGDGPAFVLLFFVLSGYVITSSLHKKNVSKIFEYFLYLIRRALRIYPAHLAAIFLIIFCIIPFKDFSKPLNEIYAPWFNFWPHKFSIREILENLTLLTAPSNSINNVTWSLYYEIYGSLFLPLFYWFNKKTNFSLQFLFLITLIYCGKHEVFLPVSPVLRYLYCFYLGSFLFWNFDLIAKKLRFFISKKMLLITIFLLIPAIRLFLAGTLNYVINILESIAAALLILNCVATKNQKNFLDGKFFTDLGKISYSFYIIQVPIIYLTFFALSKIFSDSVLIDYGLYLQLFTTFITLIFTFCAAKILYQFVELPCLKLGKKITH